MALSIEAEALHGRAAELALLDRALEQAAAGVFRAVLVEGEPGIGKTRLLDAALVRASRRGFRVYLGRADELERARPFGPLVEAFRRARDVDDPLRAEIAQLLTGGEGREPIEPTRDPGLQFRVVDAFGDLVEGLALDQPLALALDDLQWGDTSTLLTVGSLARRLRYVPLVLLLTLRPLPRSDELERLVDLLERNAAERIFLGPLDDAAVADLCAELVSAVPGDTLREGVAAAAGNPLFVGELVRALDEEGAIERVGGHAELHEVSLPPSLRLTILRRLSFLGAQTLECLRVASVLGSTFTLADVATAAGQSASELLQPVRDALRAGVLEERDARLGFRHDLIREALYGDMPESARRALHLQAGRRLAAAGSPALQVAEQLALGAQQGDAEAVAALHVAAREAARSSPAIAADLLERALELVEDADERVAALAHLVPALRWAGRPARAEARAREGLGAGIPPGLEATLRLGLVQALLAQGRGRDAIVEIDLALTRPMLTDDLRSLLLSEAAVAYITFLDDLDGGERAARDAIAVGESAHSRGVETALLVLADTARARGKLEEALALARQALEEVEKRAGEGRMAPVPALPLARALHGLDRFEEALQAVNDGVQADERLGHVALLPVYDFEAAVMLFSSGQWDDAVARAEAGLAAAEEIGLGGHSWPYELLARIAVHRGQLDQAVELLRRIDSDPEPAASLLSEARGDPGSAFAALADAWDRTETRGTVVDRRLLGPELVRLALAADDHERAETVAAGVEEAARLASVPSLEGAALRCRGLVEGDAGVLLRAVEAYRRSPRTFERAQACENAAAALGRAGRLDEARAHFDEALAVYEGVGAGWDLGRALASMRALGLRRKRRGARKRPERGWESLTPSELDVVKLAAEGLTNPEIGRRLFISRRTVQTHLAHAFRKLDISSRVELAAEAAKRGAV